MAQTLPEQKSRFDDILVTIHGIGAQSRNSTVRYVATRLAHSSISLGQPDVPPPVSPQPLGWFYSDIRDAVKVAPLDSFSSPSHPLARIGFTEVFWADIPQEVVKEGRTVEETKAWARTVVGRARAICKNKILEQKNLPAAERLRIIEPDFSLAAEVLEEIIDTVYVLQNLTFLAEKAGLMKFNLKQVLDEYLGDVQIVTEFGQFRTDIVGRFHSAMEQIRNANPGARLHIVAHSEGTVVSFLGLLHALSGEQVVPASTAGGGPKISQSELPLQWLENVHGYMTIGSPIDKHILLWPKLFESFNFVPAQRLFGDGKRIQWRNYYDYGDPVGFKLETARAWLDELAVRDQCRPFQFEAEAHDLGFARYAMPGKAHNDYWEDPTVFGHFIDDVIRGDSKNARRPRSRPLVYIFSPLIPYAISFALLVTATFMLYRSINSYTHPNLDELQRYIRFTVLGLSEEAGITGPRIFLYSSAIAALLAGVTLLARIPRLAVGWFWKAIALVAFALGCISYLGIDQATRAEIGIGFTKINWDPTVGVLLLGALVALVSLLFVQKPSHEFGRPGATPRKQRWIFKGMRPLILAGALGLAFLVYFESQSYSPLMTQEIAELSPEQVKQIQRARLSRLDLNVLFWPEGTFKNPGPKGVETITRVLTSHPPVWPVVLSAAAFLYLWWLAALIFDLGFVWQRYIRNALSNERLMTWRGYKVHAQ
jgi:hypothetical protein